MISGQDDAIALHRERFGCACASEVLGASAHESRTDPRVLLEIPHSRPMSHAQSVEDLLRPIDDRIHLHRVRQ